jgi:hypothetical protein
MIVSSNHYFKQYCFDCYCYQLQAAAAKGGRTAMATLTDKCELFLLVLLLFAASSAMILTAGTVCITCHSVVTCNIT